jgi:hypothetical protein
MSQKKIEALRGQIRTLQAERTELQQQRWSRGEVAGKVRQMVQQWDADAASKNALHLRWMARGDHGFKLLTANTVDTGSEGIYATLGPAAVHLLGADLVTARLLAGIQHVPEGLDTAERLARIAAIGAELDRLEGDEERAVCAAEADGVDVLRRADARPEIVLALAR